MKRRYKLNKRKSRKMFAKGASRTHRFNDKDYNHYAMRGGIRM